LTSNSKLSYILIKLTKHGATKVISQHENPTPMERLYATKLPLRDAEIAALYGVKTMTVKKSMQRLRDKWHCRNRTELAIELIKRGLITPVLILLTFGQLTLAGLLAFCPPSEAGTDTPDNTDPARCRIRHRLSTTRLNRHNRNKRPPGMQPLIDNATTLLWDDNSNELFLLTVMEPST
jgi:DNA-binding CsgD family transcriptional regulator